MLDKYIDFYVIIKRNNQPSGLFVEGISIDSSVTINRIHFSESVDTFSENYLTGNIIPSYSGPEFSTLDEKLQQQFLDFLVSLDIDDDLGSFLELLSLDKEERLQKDWLNSFNNII